jgi:DNA-binding MltR family transcriptional regulator
VTERLVSGFGDQLNRTFDEVFKQTDRASAIVSSALLEELLERLLLAFLADHTSVKRDLFDGIAPLSTMSAKINLAYHLGLLEQTEFEDLKIIKNVRNDFAHSFEGINFETQRIRDKCVLLKTLTSTNPPKEAMDSIKTVKSFFQINTTLLASILYAHIEEIKRVEPHRYGMRDANGTNEDAKDR